MQVVVGNDAKSMGERAASDGAALIGDAIAARGAANIIVATGASQFEMLAALTGRK